MSNTSNGIFRNREKVKALNLASGGLLTASFYLFRVCDFFSSFFLSASVNVYVYIYPYSLVSSR